jgi:hypothetical protein
MVFNPAPV